VRRGLGPARHRQPRLIGQHNGLHPVAQPELAEKHSPTWSPDGNHIAFVGATACDVSHLGTDIWTMNASGGGKVNLTRDAATDDTEPAWSPDGASILFTREGTDIMSLPAGGGAVSMVARGVDAAWGVRRGTP
jgi:Tol biopolymer transport system component